MQPDGKLEIIEDILWVSNMYNLENRSGLEKF